MPAEASIPRYKLYYWPIPFRGCFVRYLFAYRDVALLEETGFEANEALRQADPGDQPIPYVGPPLLESLATGKVLSQMPAIVLYVADELDLMPVDRYDQAIAMKVLMDCNDLLMEICRYNGSMMWDRESWSDFRDRRLPRWLRVFESSLQRQHIGTDPVNFADIAVFALFGNLLRCLPELEPDILEHAPGIHAHCQRIGSEPSLAACVQRDAQDYGTLYCGGQIEASIREMLANGR